MKRHLFLVLNHGAWNNQLPNIDVDKDGYLRFFKSPEGGLWDKDEISVYNDDFNFDVFRENIRFQHRIQDPYEFILFVFCGHGCSDVQGEQWFEIRPDGTPGSDMSLTQLRQACVGVRTLLISDACSSLYTGPLHERRMLSFVTKESISGTSYELACKTLYNKLVSLTPEGTFVAGFAASPGESARENENGGYYSQSILKETYDVIAKLKNDNRYLQYNHVTFSSIHKWAHHDVVYMSKGNQHPTIDMPRDEHQLPFAVVAR